MMPLDLSPLGLVLAFGAGLVSFASPCVLPLVPGYLAWVAGTDLTGAQARRWRTLRLGAWFALGFGAVFVASGAGATGLSGLLRRWSTEAAVAGGALVAAVGLVQMGLLRLPVPLLRDRRWRPALEGGTPAQAALVGVAFGFGWTPCIGPVLAAILAVAAAPATARSCSPPTRPGSARRSCWPRSTCRRCWRGRAARRASACGCSAAQARSWPRSARR